MAAAKEISVDATAAAVLSEMDGIFTWTYFSQWTASLSHRTFLFCQLQALWGRFCEFWLISQVFGFYFVFNLCCHPTIWGWNRSWLLISSLRLCSCYFGDFFLHVGVLLRHLLHDLPVFESESGEKAPQSQKHIMNMPASHKEKVDVKTAGWGKCTLVMVLFPGFWGDVEWIQNLENSSPWP